MAQLMDALVKPIAGPRSGAPGRSPVPDPGPRPGAHQDPQDRHLRYGCTYLQLGPLGPGAHQAPHGHRPRVRGRGGQAGRGRRGPACWPAGQRRGAYHLRPLPELPYRQHPVVQGHQGRGRGPGRRLRGVRVHPGEQRHHHRREPAGGYRLLF